MALRAGIYDRVSDDQGGRSRSTDQQGTANQEAAEQAGWRLMARYPEPDRSASRFAKKDRPQWTRLLADVAAGRLDVVVLWESSRGDRKLTGWSTFLDLCRERGVLVHVTSHRHTYDLSNPRDWKALAEDGIDSAWESEKTSLRIRRDLADAAAQGKPHGRVRYGFTRRYDPDSRELVAQEAHPEHAPVVREIIGRVAAGEAVSVLQRDLYERGVPNPTGGEHWARSTIVALVLNGVAYIGKRRHNDGPLLDGNWPALVEEDVYWRAVRVLKDPARKTATGKRGGIRPGAAKWLLSYIATCAKCDAPLGVQHRPRGGKMVPCYRCSSSRATHAIAPVEWMDDEVAGKVISYLANPERWKPEGSDREAQAARDEAEAERARLADFERQAVAGKISADSFARIAGGIEVRIAELETRAHELAVPALEPGNLFYGWQQNPRLAKSYRNMGALVQWEEMPLSAQRSLVRELFAPPGYLRLRPSGLDGRAHGVAAVDPDRIELRFASEG
jgi:site-specific DNA recombinase